MAKAENPLGTEKINGQLMRRLHITSADGSTREQLRPVAASIEEAKEKRWDWYHPELGWIREGYKLERDRDLGSILEDSTSAVPNPNLFPTPIN